MLQYYSCNISLLSASSAQNSQFKDCSLGRSLSPPSQVWLSYIFGDHVTSRQNETFRGHQCGRDTQIAAGDCEFRRNVRVIWQLTVVITSCWWRGAASSVAGGHDTVVLRHLGVTGRLVSGYSLPPPAAPTLSHIMDQMTACVRKVSSCILQKTIAASIPATVNICLIKQCATVHKLATTPADIYKYRYQYRNRNTCAHIDRYWPTKILNHNSTRVNTIQVWWDRAWNFAVETVVVNSHYLFAIWSKTTWKMFILS